MQLWVTPIDPFTSTGLGIQSTDWSDAFFSWKRSHQSCPPAASRRPCLPVCWKRCRKEGMAAESSKQLRPKLFFSFLFSFGLILESRLRIWTRAQSDKLWPGSASVTDSCYKEVQCAQDKWCCLQKHNGEGLVYEWCPWELSATHLQLSLMCTESNEITFAANLRCVSERIKTLAQSHGSMLGWKKKKRRNFKRI